MRKLLIILILFFGRCYCQDFENLTTSSSSYEKVAETKGDLDKDGVDEIVIAYQTNDVDKDSFFMKELHIYKIKGKQLKLWKRNTTVLFSKRDSYEEEDNIPKLKVANNTLIIEQTFHGSSKADDYYKNIFRFQNDDWFLIGATTVTQYNCLWEDVYDINFSTGEVVVKWKNQCCPDVNDCDENKAEKKSAFKYSFDKILMNKFTPGETEAPIPKSKKKFIY
jgi:hypothetical protein